jgi:hypothetical protein
VPRSPTAAHAVRKATARNRGGGSVVSALFSLTLVAAAVAAVAYLVVRTPPVAVNSAERVAPIGTAIVAAEIVLTTPAPAPERAAEAAAAAFRGNAPGAVALPTVATERLAEGPTPTPRILSLPTAVPSTTPTPWATTLPAPTRIAPAVALAPVSSEPTVPQAPTAPSSSVAFVPAETVDLVQSTDEIERQPMEASGEQLELTGLPRGGTETETIAVRVEQAMARAHARREARERSRAARDTESLEAPLFADSAPSAPPPINAPASIPDMSGSDDRPAVVVPDASAMVEEITARVKRPKD